MCYFTQVQFPETTGYVDLRPWMDSTPITLSHSSSMQLAVQLFEKLVTVPIPKEVVNASANGRVCGMCCLRRRGI
jgi:hypothetical protein